jgi:hypothetical protein
MRNGVELPGTAFQSSFILLPSDAIDCFLARTSQAEVGYGGFGWNSFHKSEVPDLWRRFKVQITTVQEYDDFVGKNMQR